jgi:hypothetical protein
MRGAYQMEKQVKLITDIRVLLPGNNKDFLGDMRSGGIFPLTEGESE